MALLGLAACTFGDGTLGDGSMPSAAADDDGTEPPSTSGTPPSATSIAMETGATDMGDAGTNDGLDDDLDDGEADTSTPMCAPDWWDEGWRRRIAVVVDDALTDTANDIPVALALDASRDELRGLALTGEDIRITTDDGQLLPVDIERAHSEADVAVVWFRAPQLSAGTRYWLYVDNPEATTEDDATAVWAGYEAVWHLTDTNGMYPNVTGPEIDGVATGVEVSRGPLADAARFGEGMNAIDFGPASFPLMDGWAQLSLSSWVYFDYDDDLAWEGASRDRVLERGGAVRNGRTWRENWLPPNTGFFQIDVITTAESAYRRFELTRQAWHWVVYDYDGSALTLYLDGELYEIYNPVDGPLTAQQASLRLGGPGSFRGSLDEFRVSSIARDGSWYRMQHAAMTSRLWSLGPAQTCR